jgi:hypothetical protein
MHAAQCTTTPVSGPLRAHRSRQLRIGSRKEKPRSAASGANLSGHDQRGAGPTAAISHGPAAPVRRHGGRYANAYASHVASAASAAGSS